jgi:hypothetical protein
MKIIIPQNLGQDRDTWRTVSQLNQFHHVTIYQLLQYDHIYRLAACTMAVQFNRQFNLQSAESRLPPWELELPNGALKDIVW